MTDVGWTPDDVDLLVFVSQTPDYVLPPTSSSLHARLGLSRRCAVFDLNLGCSGYVYGLWVAATLIRSAGGRALLLVGDTISKLAAPGDRSVLPLFGDAGTATALQASEGNAPWHFDLGSDGSGAAHLIVPAGGCRLPNSDATKSRTRREDGNIRSDADLQMNGAEVFAFTLREIQPLVERVMAAGGLTMADVDGFVFHQANKFMVEHLGRKIGIPKDKLVLALAEFGNTSSASIPLAIVDRYASQPRKDRSQLVLAGFGVGFSWGAVTLPFAPQFISPMVTV